MYARIGLLIIASMIIFTGCQNRNEERALPDKDTGERLVHVKNSSPENQQNLENEHIANHLANIASDVPNVNNATAIVAGPYAVVGIDIDADLDRSRVGTIKYSVSEALQHDPYGKTAVVVADADITERIRSMGEKIRAGYPVRGVVDELAAIVGRYMPDFPINEFQPPENDQNKEILPGKEREELDNIQRNQSNDKFNR